MNEQTFPTGEKLLSALRSLYGGYGYTQYKMSKFEEYDLYAHNKDFLISDSVITFTDGNGKLLALKPDVTLSIVKNTRDTDAGLRKVYYNENVYRTAKESRSFREILQVGLECIGKVDGYALCEVIDMAQKSLCLISEDNLLSLSHLGVLSELTDAAGVDEARREGVFSALGERNPHAMREVLGEGARTEAGKLLLELVRIHGTARQVMAQIGAALGKIISADTFRVFSEVVEAVSRYDNIMLDFSVVGDTRYYNGFVFNGYVRGIPQSVLSGGQYDMLMRRMNRRDNAVGFAVYLDTVEQYALRPASPDADVFLLYDETTPFDVIRETARDLRAQGKRVLCGNALTDQVICGRYLAIRHGEVTEIERNA